MDKLRHEILRINKFNVGYYNSLLDIIDNYKEEKPDITIETCKSLIEGISKLILHVVKQEPIQNLDKSNNLQDLFKSALFELDNKHEYFNDEFVKRTGSMIHVLGEIRNKQGDICHGRASVKEQINCEHFAEMVAGITEVLCVYILKKFDEISETVIKYEDYEQYNDWLDESVESFPILTASYSKVLFDYDKDFYNSNYTDVFLPSIEKDKVEEKEINIVEVEEITEIEFSLLDIDSIFFATNQQKQIIADFASERILDVGKLVNVLDNYFFTNEIPIRGELANLFLAKPTKEEEKSKAESLKKGIIQLISILIK